MTAYPVRGGASTAAPPGATPLSASRSLRDRCVGARVRKGKWKRGKTGKGMGCRPTDGTEFNVVIWARRHRSRLRIVFAKQSHFDASSWPPNAYVTLSKSFPGVCTRHRFPAFSALRARRSLRLVFCPLYPAQIPVVPHLRRTAIRGSHLRLIPLLCTRHRFRSSVSIRVHPCSSVVSCPPARTAPLYIGAILGQNAKRPGVFHCFSRATACAPTP